MAHFKNQSPYKRSLTWARLSEETIFSKWIKMRNLSFGQAAGLIGCSLRSVKYWANGQSLPDLIHAFKIQQVSNGKVPATSWLLTAVAKAKWFIPHETVRPTNKKKVKINEQETEDAVPRGSQSAAHHEERGMHPVILLRDGEQGSEEGTIQQAKAGSQGRQKDIRGKEGTSDPQGDEGVRVEGGRATSTTPGRRQRDAGKRRKAGSVERRIR